MNGADITTTVNPAGKPVPSRWYQVGVTNNMIVDNVAGWSGGGISLIDTLNASIVNNTVASNDSTGIAGAVLIGGVGRPAPSGIASETTTTALHNLLLGLTPGQAVANAVVVVSEATPDGAGRPTPPISTAQAIPTVSLDATVLLTICTRAAWPASRGRRPTSRPRC